MWSCAWVSPDERSGQGMVPGEYPYDPREVDICAGYLVSLPQVIEAARASSWRRDGELRMFYEDGITDIARTAIDIISAEFKSVEQYCIRERSKGGA